MILYTTVMKCCFFYKKKTAYEMSISDWSSDVCSSDLCEDRGHRAPLRGPQAGAGTRAARRQCAAGGRDAGGAWLRAAGQRGGRSVAPRDGAAPEGDAGAYHRDARRAASRTDRKSVVSGQGVLVRVVIGGRRIIKKKNIYENKQK